MGEMECYILAGGKSSRFGENKALAHVRNKAIIERQLTVFSKMFSKIVIVADEMECFRFLGCQHIADKISGFGPLGGIYSALCHTKEDKIFVTACDLPFPAIDLLEQLLFESNGYDITVFMDGKYYEPLFTVYSKACLARISWCIGQGKRQIISFFDDAYLKINRLPLEDIYKIGIDKMALFNVNTKRDLAKANELYDSITASP